MTDAASGAMITDVMPVADEVFATNSTASPADRMFDAVVGQLQEIVITPEFQDTRDRFLEQYSPTFEDTEENKLEYMPIFKSWTQLIETYLETNLKRAIPEFSMAEFVKLLGPRQGQIDGELFEMLASLGDFSSFKEEMLMFKQSQLTEASMDFGSCFVVHSC